MLQGNAIKISILLDQLLNFQKAILDVIVDPEEGWHIPWHKVSNIIISSLSRICPIDFVGLHTQDIVLISVPRHSLLESL